MSYKSTRSSLLIDYYENDSGKVKLFTQLDTGLSVGDIVYIQGGDFDNVSILFLNDTNPYVNTELFGYTVLTVYPSTNAITIDYEYNGSLSVGTKTVISRTAFSAGEFIYGNFYDGVMGQEYPDLMKFGPETIPSFYSTSITALPLRMFNGVFKYGTFRAGRVGDFTGALISPVSVSGIKNTLITGGGISTVVTGINNDGLGYITLMDALEYGSDAYPSLMRFYNGTILGGEWINGIFDNGLMKSLFSTSIFTNGTANGGTFENVKWENGNASSVTFNNNTIRSTNLSVDGTNSFLRLHMTKENINLFSDTDYIMLTDIENPMSLIPAGGGYNEVVFEDSFLYVDQLTDRYIDDGTNTYYLEIAMPTWFDYMNIAAYNLMTGVTFAYVKAGVVSGSIFGGMLSNILETAYDNLQFGGVIGSTVVYNSTLLAGTITSSRIKSSYLKNGTASMSWIQDGRYGSINTSMVRVSGGVFESGQYSNTTFKYEPYGATGIILAGGYFDMSVADNNIYWDTINYMSGIFPTYSGPTYAYPGLVYANTNIVETEWLYQLPGSSLVPQQYAIANSGPYNSNKYSVVAALLTSLYEYDRPVDGDPVTFKVAASGTPVALDSFSTFITSPQAVQIDLLNDGHYKGLSPGVLPIESYDGNFKPTTSFPASYKMKILRPYPTYTYPVSYVITIVAKNLNTLVEYEYNLVYPATFALPATPPGEFYELYVKITSPGTNSLPGNALNVTTFTVDENAVPYAGSPFPAGQNIPDVYSPAPYTSPTSYKLTGVPPNSVIFAGNNTTFTYDITLGLNTRLLPGGPVTPTTVSAMFQLT